MRNCGIACGDDFEYGGRRREKVGRRRENVGRRREA
jgi:hypothetical protein